MNQGGMKRLISCMMRLSGESMAGRLASELQEAFIVVRVWAWLRGVLVSGQDLLALPCRYQGRELKSFLTSQPNVALVNTHGSLWV